MASPESGAPVDASTLQRWLSDGCEIALLDVREAGLAGEGRPFLAVNAPYSRLELAVPSLVPRRTTRVVLLDGGEEDSRIGRLSARRLAAAGYVDVRVLAGGAPAWGASGRTLFQGVNLPSKTFGELAEHRYGVPHVGADALRAMQASGVPLLLLDGRTLAEHRKMTIPGSVPVPNGELARRWAAVAPAPDVPVVVHCAGRTRSIVGAQILRDMGVANPVYALENGTQGWALAGHALERGSGRGLPAAPPKSASPAASGAAIGADEAQAWLDDRGRTTFVFDVRTEEEVRTRTLAGATHAPGGQLIQATDHWIGTRHARVLLVDDDGLRAPVVARWLRRLGFEARAVAAGIDAPLRVPPVERVPIDVLPRPAPASLADARLGGGHAVIDLRPSMTYRQGHAGDAAWSTRSRVVAEASRAGLRRPVLLVADEPGVAALAALDLREAGVNEISWASAQDLLEAGWPEVATPDRPSDADAVDYLFFVHDRHDGNLEAARRYLEWETGLVEQCHPDELATFRLDAA